MNDTVERMYLDAWNLTKIGRHAEALEIVEAGVAMDPAHRGLLQVATHAYDALGRDADEYRVAEARVDLDPGDLDAQVALAGAMLGYGPGSKRHRAREARRMAESVVEVAPWHDRAWFTLVDAQVASNVSLGRQLRTVKRMREHQGDSLGWAVAGATVAGNELGCGTALLALLFLPILPILGLYYAVALPVRLTRRATLLRQIRPVLAEHAESGDPAIVGLLAEVDRMRHRHESWLDRMLWSAQESGTVPSFRIIGLFIALHLIGIVVVVDVAVLVLDAVTVNAGAPVGRAKVVATVLLLAGTLAAAWRGIRLVRRLPSDHVRSVGLLRISGAAIVSAVVAALITGISGPTTEHPVVGPVAAVHHVAFSVQMVVLVLLAVASLVAAVVLRRRRSRRRSGPAGA